MALDATELTVGANGQIYVAPAGTALPTTVTGVLNAAFVNVGFASQDGVTLRDEKTIQNIEAWQSFYPVRKLVTGRNFIVSFVLEQWNETTVPFAFGGGAVTAEGGGVYRYDPPDPEVLDERALVIDWQDGDNNFRFVLVQGIVQANVETKVARTDIARLPIELAAVGVAGTKPYYLLSDAPAFLGASS